MNKVLGLLIAVALLLVGFALAFQAGKSEGFRTGSEWAIVQADIIAREAGLHMPVYLDDDNFRIVIRQQRGIYKRAWKLADRHEETREALRAELSASKIEPAGAPAELIRAAGDEDRALGAEIHAEGEPAKEDRT